MENLNGLKLKYTSPAYPPDNIHITWIYTIEINEDKTYITDGNLVIEMPLEIIKQYFTPIDNSWNDLLLSENLKKSKK